MGTLTRDELREIYRALVLTREVEEKLERLAKQGELVGNLYRSLGQEATAVGSASALEDGDWVCPAIRDLGALFARGLDPEEMFLQYLARGPSLTGARDTTTHFIDPELGLLGPISPMGTAISVMAGMARAFRVAGSDRVCLTYQSEGGSRAGAFHEGTNLAAVEEVPLVLVLEHNRWAYSTPSEKEGAVDSWADVAGAYDLPVRHVDGNDVLEVHDATAEAVERARSGGGASMVVAETYRMTGHAQHDDQRYVPEEELEAWRERDPIDRFEAHLVEYGYESESGLEELRSAVRERVEEAAASALSAPPPRPGSARTGVYAEEAGGEADAAVPWTRRPVVGYPDLPAGVEGWPGPGVEDASEGEAEDG
jgi:pyruvate dehydrogenase E1 component alpha subunit/2-oxoisovalerate dehydrogenase E1 component alpha subunit